MTNLNKLRCLLDEDNLKVLWKNYALLDNMVWEDLIEKTQAYWAAKSLPMNQISSNYIKFWIFLFPYFFLSAEIKRQR